MRNTFPLLWAGVFLAGLLPAGAQAEELLHAGPLLGYAAQRSAAVWVQTARPCWAQLRLHPAGESQAARLSARVRTGPDGIHTFILDGLEPGTRYAYQLYLDGREVVRPYPLGFTTRPLWQWRRDAPDLTLLVGSCAYVNQPAYDRPGEPYGGGHAIFRTMAGVPADAMVWLGDNVYLREVDFFTAEGIAARYRHDRALPALQPLLAAMPHYATWDDHDYGPNDSDAAYPLKGAALATFQRYWPAAHYGLPDVPGVFQKVALSDVDLFLLDDRYYRMPLRWPDGPDKRFLGRAQLAWLQAALLGSRARFKLVACGSQVLNARTKHESFQHYPVEAEALLEWIVERRITGVLFLSGDRHHSELLRIERPGCYPLYEFTSSPLTAGFHTHAPDQPEFAHPERVPDTLLSERAFGVVQALGPPEARRIAFEARAADGTPRWRHEVPAEALRFPE